MSDKNNKKNEGLRITGDIVAMLTEKLTKNGRLKGANKKETKNLEAACVHHSINKKGKVKAKIETDGNGNCTCEMCSHTFPTSFPDNDEIRRKFEDVFDILDTAKFASIATDAGKETSKTLSLACVSLRIALKLVYRMKEMAEKQENIKKNKKNKKKGFGGGSSEFGSWSAN